MVRTKDDVQKAAAATLVSSEDTSDVKRRGRPAKDVTSADTGAGVKKPAAKRGRPAGSSTKPKEPKEAKEAKASATTDAAAGTTKRRGRPPGSTNKPKTSDAKKSKSASSTAKKLREFLPAIAPEEKTTGADRRRAKMADNKLEMLPSVKKSVNPNDGRRKNKGVAKGAVSKGVTPKKKASSPLKRDSPVVGKASSPTGAAAE